MKSLVFTSAVEMNEVFGFNPCTDQDFEEMNISSDAYFVADMKNRTFIVNVGNQSFGSFEMSQNDFQICLKLMGEEIVSQIETDEKIWVDVNPVTSSKGTDTDVTLLFSLDDDSEVRMDEDNGEKLSELAIRITDIVMEAVGCDGPMLSAYEGQNGNGIRFNFENCQWA